MTILIAAASVRARKACRRPQAMPRGWRDKLATSGVVAVSPALAVVAHAIENDILAVRPPPDEFSMILRV